MCRVFDEAGGQAALLAQRQHGPPAISLCTIARFSRTLRGPNMACFFRSSVIRRTPLRMASLGLRGDPAAVEEELARGSGGMP